MLWQVASRAGWFAEHDPEKWPLWVAVDAAAASTIAGWISLSPFYRRVAWDGTAEVSVYVSPAYQRCGIARMLLRHAIATMGGFGKRKLMAIIYEHNVPSRALFEAEGFVDWGRLPDVCDVDGTLRSVVILGRDR